MPKHKQYNVKVFLFYLFSFHHNAFWGAQADGFRRFTGQQQAGGPGSAKGGTGDVYKRQSSASPFWWSVPAMKPTPLARMEWVKLYGILLGKQQVRDALHLVQADELADRDFTKISDGQQMCIRDRLKHRSGGCGTASAAPRSPDRLLELCGIAFILSFQFFTMRGNTQ